MEVGWTSRNTRSAYLTVKCVFLEIVFIFSSTDSDRWLIKLWTILEYIICCVEWQKITNWYSHYTIGNNGRRTFSNNRVNLVQLYIRGNLSKVANNSRFFILFQTTCQSGDCLFIMWHVFRGLDFVRLCFAL